MKAQETKRLKSTALMSVTPTIRLSLGQNRVFAPFPSTKKTGIQALEPVNRGKPVRPGLIEKREFEYRRHGTQTLLAGMDIVTGKIIPLIRDTRAEEDFADWLDRALTSDPNAAGWHFVMDRLNTHMCEAAVRGGGTG